MHVTSGWGPVNESAKHNGSRFAISFLGVLKQCSAQQSLAKTAARLWDLLCKDTDELQFNPRLDLSDSGITTQATKQMEEKSRQSGGGGEREGKFQNVYTGIKHENTGLAELRITSRSSPFIVS